MKELFEFKLSLNNNQIQLSGYLTRPGYHEHKVLMTKCLHINLNKRPVEGTKRLNWIFMSLYRDFMIPEKTVPFVFIHFEMDHSQYDIKLQADLRKFFFKPEIEKQIYEKLRSYFLQEFNKRCPSYNPEALLLKAKEDQDADKSLMRQAADLGGSDD